MTRRLLILNGLAAFCLPIFHAVMYGFQAMFAWAEPGAVPDHSELGSLTYFVMLTVRQLSSFSIPAFIFVSGFFVAFLGSGPESKVNKDALFSRIKVLLIPFALWTIFNFILVGRRPNSVGEVLRAYYYIPLVIQFYLLSPLLIPLAKKRWKLLLGLVILLHLTLAAAQYLSVLGVDFPGRQLILRATPIWFFPERLFWFVFGIVFSLHLAQALKPWLSHLRWPLLAVTLFFALLSVIEYELVNRRVSPGVWLGPNFNGLMKEFYSLGVLVTFAAFADKGKLPLGSQLTELGVKSLGIYLANSPVIYVVSSLIYNKIPWLLGQPFLYQGLLFIFGLGVPLLLMSISIRWPVTRSGYRYVFG
jgi:probable poly-beta-1,6-N-acetyl-D-glucosamine export protein